MGSSFESESHRDCVGQDRGLRSKARALLESTEEVDHKMNGGVGQGEGRQRLGPYRGGVGGRSREKIDELAGGSSIKTGVTCRWIGWW
ncbi:hypothetical protein HAX54_034662 [Datura stramonium]|uniref:Uncharacterized protein n=1 Tax=Datura stramonium TaxID=4076 RepID=A0ABS8VFY8_DATST|nr:hypothetical protein [Datura stramonium]